MQTFEINLWKDKKIVEKVVKQFESDEQVMEYIKNDKRKLKYQQVRKSYRRSMLRHLLIGIVNLTNGKENKNWLSRYSHRA